SGDCACVGWRSLSELACSRQRVAPVPRCPIPTTSKTAPDVRLTARGRIESASHTWHSAWPLLSSNPQRVSKERAMPDLTHLPIGLISEFIKDRDIFKLSLVSVAAVEVTQAIQWFEASRHLTDPADRGPDNGVTLVANKPAWVRIYVGGFIEH